MRKFDDNEILLELFSAMTPKMTFTLRLLLMSVVFFLSCSVQFFSSQCIQESPTDSSSRANEFLCGKSGNLLGRTPSFCNSLNEARRVLLKERHLVIWDGVR